MMRIGTRGRYALSVMFYLASNYDNNKYISLKEISDNEGLSYNYLEKIMIDAALITLPGTHYAYIENLDRVCLILNEFLMEGK